MKVVNIISGKDLGGPKQSFVDYGEMLTNLGFEVHYIVRPKAKCLHLLKHIPQSQIHIVNYYRSNINVIKNTSINNLRKVLTKIEPKLIFAHKQFDLSLIKAAVPNIYLIGIIHGYNANNTEHANHLIAVSSSVQKWLIERTKTPCIKIANTVKVNSEACKIRQRPTTIGTMAVFRRKKQINHIIHACNILKQKNIDFKTIIAGRGLRKYWYILLISLYKLNNNIQITDWVKNKAEFFNNIDIYCVTSKTESFNISLIEAMSFNTSVISSRCGGPEDIIDHNINGLLYDTNNIQQLSNNLELLITNKSIREGLSKQGLKKVKNEFALDIITVELKNFINSIEFKTDE